MRIRMGNWSGNVWIIIGILFLIIALSASSCMKENYSNIYAANIFSDVNSPPPTITDWSQPTLLITPDQPLSQAVIDIVTRPKQPIPLPDGQLDMFATTSFSPKCCPNSFSSSMGCACMTLEQQKYLNQRGGNNT